MSSAAKSHYHDEAQSALAELDTEKADQRFSELVESIEAAYNKNQKDVAAELQRIAKEIEADGQIEDSLRFKQRTCEIMLRRSMADRRRNQSPPAPGKDTKALNQMLFICFTHDPATYSAFLQKTGLAQELRMLPDGARWMRSKDSQLMLICRQGRMSGYFPLFVALSREDAARHQQSNGHFLDGEEVDICGMKLLVMKDKHGQRFLLGGAEILQAI